MDPRHSENSRGLEEFEPTDPLLSHAQEALPTPDGPVPGARAVLFRLYTSHALSAWNSRMFEFGAVLFLASIFPGTLLYASTYALVRALSAVALSSWLGAKVDKLDRLVVLRHSIVWQRIPVAASCLCFVTLLATGDRALRLVLFFVLGFLACLEKLASSANTVAVERDWAVVIAENVDVPRRDLNASMRRIDLFCKLIAPLFISLVDSLSSKVAIWTVMGLNTASVAVEYVAIAQVYSSVPALKRQSSGLADGPDQEIVDDNPQSAPSYFWQTIAPWQDYVISKVFLPSFSLSLLYLTVLSFGGTMVTYLLHSGFNPLEISCMRIGSVAAEISGTWTAPLIMRRIGPIRSGLWFLNWQFCCVAGAAVGFAFWDSSSRLGAAVLITGVALSRIGLWGFDLSAQFLVQENVEEQERARFSTTEMALQNIFEMMSFASTIVWAKPEQFHVPVFVSAGAVAVAAIGFAAYVRRERGHLVHRSKCLGGDKVVYQSVDLESPH